MELFHSIPNLHNPHLGLKSFFVLVAALVVIVMSQAVVATESLDAPEDLTHIWVLEVEVALRAYRGPKGGPTWGSRNSAIAFLALHDGYQLFVREYDSYLVYSPELIAQADQILQSFPDQSEALGEIAAAGAIAEALGALYPPGSLYDSALAQSIEVADPSHSLDAATIDATVSLGRQVGARLVLVRSSDGSEEAAQADLDYVLPPANGQPGLWSPDPTVTPAQRALGVAWGSVKPFAMRNVHEYVIPPPQAFSSEPWANTYNQVKLWGEWNSTVRSEEELETAYFWAYDRSGMGPPINIFNHWAENVANVRGLVMSDKVRLLALSNMAMADAGIAAWEWKYVYNLWRPITGIRNGGTDNNPRTVAQPDWRPLGAPAVPVYEGDEMIPVATMTVESFTPPFPAYPSGHATFGEAVAEVLRNVVGTEKFEYSIQSDEMPSELKTRNYTSLDQPSYENCISRIYLGVHWIIDCNSGYILGRDIAMNVAFNWLKPIGAGGFQISDSDSPPDGECSCTRTTRKRSRRNVRRTRVAAMKK